MCFQCLKSFDVWVAAQKSRVVTGVHEPLTSWCRTCRCTPRTEPGIGARTAGPPCSGFRPDRGSAVPLVTWFIYNIEATFAKYTVLINTLSVNVLRGSDVCRDSAHKTCKLNRGSRRRRVARHRHRGARARAIERLAIGDDGGVGGTGLAEHRCDL